MLEIMTNHNCCKNNTNLELVDIEHLVNTDYRMKSDCDKYD